MKKQIVLVLLLAVLAVVGLYVYFAVAEPVGPDDDNSAAFRDGSYLGARDANAGEVPHIALGRWSTEADRRGFIRGYKAAYEQTLIGLDRSKAMIQNVSAAYRDGLFLGKRDAEQGRLAHVSSGRWGQALDRELFTWGYRQAYLEVIAALELQTQPTSQALLVSVGRN